MHDKAQIIELENDWTTNPRWEGVVRKYPASEAMRLRGSIQLHYTLAEMGAPGCGICCIPSCSFARWGL